MVKKLTRHGNSMALVLDKPILELLKIDAETALEISTDGAALIVAPVRDAKREARFQNALQNANRKYGGMLKRLAK